MGCYVYQVGSAVDRHSQLLEDIQQHQLRSLANAQSQLARDLDTKATVAAVRSCVKRQHFDEVVSTLGAALDNKGDLEQLANLTQQHEVSKCWSVQLIAVVRGPCLCFSSVMHSDCVGTSCIAQTD